MANPQNRVLTEGYHRSPNFFASDKILHTYLQRHLPKQDYAYMHDKLDQLGRSAATAMDELSQQADKNSPVLKKRNKLGEDINEVYFHPAYDDLMEIAAQSKMFYLKYHPEMDGKFEGSRHRMGFAAGQLYGMSELGQYCPHCMTDGAAYLIEQFASKEDKKRLLPKLGADNKDELFSGAMFLTEKSGGSDVGANCATAQHVEEDRYKLNGEKWFCSNVNADVIMALARTGKPDEGTKGLSLFLVEKHLPSGERNPMEIIRLKEKLGVRSMATGEVRFDDTVAKRLGKEGKGFKVMAQMINISRNYNSVAALAGFRRALVEAWEYLNHRTTFGKIVTRHALVRQKFNELGSKYLANFLLVWRGLQAMDGAENGDKKEQQLLRIITPMAKWRSAELSVYGVRECMELMGGNGYIEDFVMPKILRDVNVLPIWEGSGNIIVLDMLRAAQKTEGLSVVLDIIESAARRTNKYGELISDQLREVKSVWGSITETTERDEMEATSKPVFKRTIKLLEMALLIEEQQEAGSNRYKTALQYYANSFDDNLMKQNPPSLQEIDELMGWKY